MRTEPMISRDVREALRRLDPSSTYGYDPRFAVSNPVQLAYWPTFPLYSVRRSAAGCSVVVNVLGLTIGQTVIPAGRHAQRTYVIARQNGKHALFATTYPPVTKALFTLGRFHFWSV